MGQAAQSGDSAIAGTGRTGAFFVDSTARVRGISPGNKKSGWEDVAGSRRARGAAQHPAQRLALLVAVQDPIRAAIGRQVLSLVRPKSLPFRLRRALRSEAF